MSTMQHWGLIVTTDCSRRPLREVAQAQTAQENTKKDASRACANVGNDAGPQNSLSQYHIKGT